MAFPDNSLRKCRGRLNHRTEFNKPQAFRYLEIPLTFLTIFV